MSSLSASPSQLFYEIRLATPADAPAIERLAALDSARPLHGEVLVALVDGEPWAAIAVADGRAIADPFLPSGHAVELLQVRADHLRRPDPGRFAVRRALQPRRAA